ncbi:MAG: hypothetical protein R3B81_04955 [bacterium]
MTGAFTTADEAVASTYHAAMRPRFRPHVSLLGVLALAALASGCTGFAPPPPLFTYGGPETAGRGNSEVALGVGTGVALFTDAHSGASGWFGRYRRGISADWDLGVDVMGLTRTDAGTLGLKLAARRALAERWRAELGFGAADDSDGKSLGVDVGVTWGTVRRRPWNLYASVRAAGVKGYAGNVIFSSDTPDPEDAIAPPDTFFGVLGLGATGRLSDSQEFVFEVGVGGIAPEGTKGAPAFYVSAGLRGIVGSAGPE